MHIQYFDPTEVKKRIQVRIPPPPGWKSAAYGGVKAHHFTSVEHQAKAKAVHISEKPSMTESAFEICVELSILRALPGPRMVFMEVGAGWGGQALTIQTAVANHVVNTAVREVYSYAIEPEPGHYQFLIETFQENRIPGIPIYGAVSDKLSWPTFYAVRPSASNYGQAIHPRGNIQVPCYTLPSLLTSFKIEEVDLVHMDVQGFEPQVLLGGKKVLYKFRYLIVCPHYTEHIPIIQTALKRTHREVLTFGPRSGYHELEGFPLPIHMPQDGISVWERR